MLSIDSILPYLIRALVFCIAIPFHECAHALASLLQGDPSAKAHGRLTMNPVAHFHPVGFLCMVLFGVGFARPVPVNARYYKNPKYGMALTAAAGPFSNLVLAYFSMILYKVWYYCAPVDRVNELLAMFFYYMVVYNVVLAVFNLLPVPPWDGSRIFLLFLPQRLYFNVMRYERQIMAGMFFLLALGVLDGPLAAARSVAFRLLNSGTGYVDLLIFALNGR